MPGFATKRALQLVDVGTAPPELEDAAVDDEAASVDDAPLDDALPPAPPLLLDEAEPLDVAVLLDEEGAAFMQTPKLHTRPAAQSVSFPHPASSDPQAAKSAATALKPSAKATRRPWGLGTATGEC